jgi:hypothetical protein
MFETETQHKAAGNYAWFAAKDARQRSLANASHYTDAQKAKADRIKFALELVYYCETISIDYCKKWIRVKVHKPSVKDKKNLAILETDWNTQGVIKVATDQGVIYRVV